MSSYVFQVFVQFVFFTQRHQATKGVKLCVLVSLCEKDLVLVQSERLPDYLTGFRSGAIIIMFK